VIRESRWSRKKLMTLALATSSIEPEQEAAGRDQQEQPISMPSA
jgi:hypothetical protein